MAELTPDEIDEAGKVREAAKAIFPDWHPMIRKGPNGWVILYVGPGKDGELERKGLYEATWSSDVRVRGRHIRD